MDKRVKFDFEIYFTNGGSIKGEDFRLDILSDTISDKDLVDYLIEDFKTSYGRTNQNSEQKNIDGAPWSL